VTIAGRLRLAPLAAAALLAAGSGFAQTTDSALVAELKRYLNERDAAHPEAPPPTYGVRIAPVVSAGVYGFMASGFF
jgi:hypothetical protein